MPLWNRRFSLTAVRSTAHKLSLEIGCLVREFMFQRTLQLTENIEGILLEFMMGIHKFLPEGRQGLPASYFPDK